MQEPVPDLAPPPDEPATGPCIVCDDPLDPIHQAFCSSCLQFFHLRMTENVEAKDCGAIYFDEETCSMVFNCNPCYADYIERVYPPAPRMPGQPRPR